MAVDFDPAASAEVVAHLWQPGSSIPVPADVAAGVLRAIYAERRAVRPADIVEVSQRPDAPLHDCFEWDDGLAAIAHREEQAAKILRSIKVVYRLPDGTQSAPLREYVRILPRADDPAPDAATEEVLQPRHYIPLRRTMTEVELRRRLVDEAWRSLVAWRGKYRDLSEFARVFDAIDEQAAARKAATS